jgi:hypothetical protein
MPDVEMEDRRGALDAFAQAGANAGPPATIPAAGVLGDGAGMRVVGAQKVAVLRDESKVLQRLRVLAAAAGDDWYFRWPVKEKKTGKITWVEGPSIKLANDLARLYGNDEIETRVIDLGDSWLIYARFTDYESGFSLTRPFQQRKSQRTMGDDADRQRDIAFQIGCSKAIRNVTVNALQTFADFAFEEAKGALVDKIGRDLPKWRAKTIEKLEAKVDIKRVEAVIGRAAGDWLAPDVAMVIAMMRAISDGMATADESFPPLAAAPDRPAPGALDQFANTDSGAGQTADDPPSAGPQPPAQDEAAGGGEPPRSSPAANSPEKSE